MSPLASRALFGVPAGELAGADVAADLVLGRVAGELQARVAEASSWSQRFAILDRVLSKQAGDRPLPPRPVREAWRLLLASGGTVSIAALAHEVGWSERQLSKQFGREIGLSPMLAARVIRFHHARNAIAARAGSVAEAAAKCGYADQSHLHREFRQFAGVPPSTWLDEEFRTYKPPSFPRRRLVTMNTTTPAPQVWPTLRAQNARALIRLVDIVGFKEVVVYGEGSRPPCAARLATRRRRDARLGSRRRRRAPDADPGHVQRLCRDR